MKIKRNRLLTPEQRPLAALADYTASIAPGVLHAVLHDRQPLRVALAKPLSERARLTALDRAWLVRAFSAVLRWWGWIEPLPRTRVEETLLLGWLLDSPEVGPVARAWAARVGRQPDRLVPVGDAPSWTGRAEGLKRWAEGKPVNADPWRLFPDWLRDELPVPPGDGTPKVRRLQFLESLQSTPGVWVSARGAEPAAIWNELRDAGLKPWIHRRLKTAARLPAETDLGPFHSYKIGRLVSEDLASQAVAIVCDPDPGERWWDVRGQGWRHAAHLAALMHGKGLVVSTFEHEPTRHATALKLRHTPFHNVTTRLWDGKRPTGKLASHDGVLVDAPCSGVGGWRRAPDARWTVRSSDIPTLAAEQLRLLKTASGGVRPGGSLVYTVVTVTRQETMGVVQAFLDASPDFQLQPFPHPLEESATTGTLQLWPHIHDGDARFIAKLVRSTKPSLAPGTPP